MTHIKGRKRIKAKFNNLCFVNNSEVRLDFRISFAPIHVLDYTYAVLHSTTYSEKHKGLLKNDFPIVPYPKD